MTSGSRQHLGHIRSLDGLRGIAVILVLLRHLHIFDRDNALTGVSPLDHFFRGGYLGVDIFFVLSGFLITSLLLNEQEAHNKIYLLRFYGRRFLRLLPALTVLLLLYSIITVLDGESFSAISPGIFASFFYYLNWQYVYSFPQSFGDLGYLWSLSIEEQFYIIWPAALILLTKATRSAAIKILFIALVVALVMWHRHSLWTAPSDVPYKLITVFVRTDARIDSLLIGCIAAFVYRHNLISTKICRSLALVGVVVLLAHIQLTKPYTNYMFNGGFTIVALSVAFIVLGLTDSNFFLSKVLSHRFIVVIGKTSYGIYLWHYPIIKFIERNFATADKLFQVLLALIVTAIFTATSWLIIEAPALGLKKRLFSVAS